MKTKVTETLTNSGYEFKLYNHKDFATQIKSPNDFARQLGYEISRITKSLFVRSTKKDAYAILVCSMDKKINFKKVASILGCKKVEVANRDELKNLIGYPPNGVSPIGIPEVPSILDSGLKEMETVLLGAGAVGLEVEITPEVLSNVTGAVFHDITQD
jgi:Cys-tRNA(Pro)/Cys-tRNA(Cys) deacylase